MQDNSNCIGMKPVFKKSLYKIRRQYYTESKLKYSLA